jgi:hypothetical protein
MRTRGRRSFAEAWARAIAMMGMRALGMATERQALLHIEIGGVKGGTRADAGGPWRDQGVARAPPTRRHRWRCWRVCEAAVCSSVAIAP